MKETLAKMKTVFAEMYPKDDFQFIFYDEFPGKLYEPERQTEQLMNFGTGIAIFISCMACLVWRLFLPGSIPGR